jgi:putative DNA primase/helicase
MDNDAARSRFLARAVGYSLTGLTIEQVFFLCHGVGSNGKTTFLEVLRHVLGDYAQTADFNSFLISKGQAIRNDLAKLQGARFVSATESEAGKRMAESVVKQLTGGDTICARFLYGEHFEFRPHFKLWLATNHKPHIVGTDEAIWRRIRLIPFTITIPKEQCDRGLAGKLKQEASGILNWGLTGLRDWQQRGLSEPEVVLAATAEYRESQDALGHFVATKCAVGPNCEERAGELYRAYKESTEASGEFRMSDRDFSSALVDRGFTKKRVGARAGKPAGLYWKGLSLAV